MPHRLTIRSGDGLWYFDFERVKEEGSIGWAMLRLVLIEDAPTLSRFTQVRKAHCLRLSCSAHPLR
jgi:hypothetical protein